MLLFTAIVCRDTEKVILECMHENLIFNFFWIHSYRHSYRRFFFERYSYRSFFGRIFLSHLRRAAPAIFLFCEEHCKSSQRSAPSREPRLAHGGGVAGLAGRKLQEYLVQPGPWAVVLELRAHRQDCTITVPAQPISSRAHECAAGLTGEPPKKEK